MSRKNFTIGLHAILICVTLSTFNFAVASSPALGENGMHISGAAEQQLDRRRYARVLTNLDSGEPFTVRVILFHPNDHQPRSDINAVLDSLVKQVQKFYSDEMERHGFGGKTFRLETDVHGKVVVHRVEGKFSNAHYYGDAIDRSYAEVAEKFDDTRNINLVWIDLDDPNEDWAQVGGAAGGNSFGGVAWLSATDFDIAPPLLFVRAYATIAHELGHAFGLPHDYRDDRFIMSYGDSLIQDQLSRCAAEWLNAHRYFNANPTNVDEDLTSVQPPNLSLVSPPNTIRIRFGVSDADGLRHALLLSNAIDPATEQGNKVLDCISLNGEGSVELEFDTSEFAARSENVTLVVIDSHGNFSHHYFPIDVASLRLASKVVSIPDANLGAAIRANLGLSASADITESDMLDLTTLTAPESQISDLTGLEHAKNLKYVKLMDNQISDLTPIAGATRLKSLLIKNNRIVDLNPLAGLTLLSELWLWTNQITDLSPLAGLRNLTFLKVGDNKIRELSPLAGLSKLRDLGLGSNQITDITPLAELTLLGHVGVYNNQISDLAPLVRLNYLENVIARTNPLSYQSIHIHIPALENSGVLVEFDDIAYPTLLKISGVNQIGLPGEALPKPFVVEVQNENGFMVAGTQVTFTVVTGGGTLSATNTVTDGNGRAGSTLTLGPNLGRNLVEVTAAGIKGKHIFSAEGVRVPTALQIVSGNAQQGLPGAALAKPLVVEVRDQTDEPFPGAQVTFAVSSGGGTLSVTNIITGSNGRAESVLTLGPEPGTNTVDVSVIAVEGMQSFSAEGVRIPKKFAIVSGNDQEGLPGTALENAFVVEVRDQFDEPFPGAQVKFAITSGGGTLSATSVTTDSNGRAESTLTLGSEPGTNTVTVSVTGIQEKQTFSAEGIRIPTALQIVSGDAQQGQSGAALEKAFVVEVRDQFDNPLSDVQVTFTVTSGGGTLSATSVTTDSDGRAESTLTLGPEPGANTVTVSVTGVQEEQTFTAEGVRVPDTLELISGINQKGLPGFALADPFVVEVRDQFDKPFAGAQVTFSVSTGGGTLSATSVTSDSIGRAESRLTLGPEPGTNSVTVSVTGIQEEQTFTAEGIRIPKTLAIVSGNDQEGLPGTALEKAFVVEVRDQFDEPLPEVQVTFSVTSGGGTLSVTSVTTDSSGRAESTLTLGPEPGANAVTVSVTGIQGEQAFSAEGIRVPKTFAIISGMDQEGLPGTALEKAFVVEVRDQFDHPLPEVQVTFAVTGGGGTLSAASVTTDSNGRAESIFTLGPNPGTNTVEVEVTGIQEKQTVSTIAKSHRIPQDVNGDDVVNILDLVLVASVIGTVGPDLAPDVNGDGVVNILDLVSVAGALGTQAAAPTVNPEVVDFLTAADVGEWLAQARGLDLTDATSQRGIHFLEQLLSVLPPQETALLANYPNPFNPETWMPYQLSQPRDVRLTVYSTTGEVVRTFDLGYQAAGEYESQGRAAYWDGTNDSGDTVASGIYFYTMKAGEFSATRKMLIRK